MRTSITIVLSLGLVLTIVNFSTAQDRNDRRRQFFEGVLRTLIESQVDRDPAPNNPPPNRPPGRNPQLAAAHQTLERFSDESGHLIAALHHEEQANPAFRSLLADMVPIKANADVLIRRVPFMDVAQFTNEYQAIDRQWRLVSHRLRQAPGVDRACLAHIDKLNVYDQQICELLNLQPQLDRFELTRQVAELRVSLQTLFEDLRYVLNRQPGGQTFLLQGQTLLASVDRLERAIGPNPPHQVVVANYQQVYASWRQIAKQLRSLNDPHIVRRIQRIEASHDAIHELLWIPKTIDRDEVIALVKAFQREVNAIHNGITLDYLIEHPQPQDTVASAMALSQLCASLSTSLAGQTSFEELAWDVRMLEVEWQTASNHLRFWNAVELKQRLAVADQTLATLVRMLGQELTIDPQEVVALVASVHAAADSLASQVVRLVNSSNQYPSPLRGSAQATARAFQDAAHHFHESIARHESDEHLRRDCLELATTWEAVQNSVAELSPQHRGVLNPMCRPLGPQIAKLQILYVY